MNFLSMMANRLSDHFNPYSSGAGVGNIMHGDGGLTGRMNGGQPGGVAGAVMQPQQAQPDTGVMNADATHNQEAMAKQRGFSSYNQMMDWARQRTQHRDSQTVAGNPMQDSGAQQAPMGLNTAMQMHPRNMFNWIKEAITNATGMGQ